MLHLVQFLPREVLQPIQTAGEQLGRPYFVHPITLRPGSGPGRSPEILPPPLGSDPAGEGLGIDTQDAGDGGAAFALSHEVNRVTPTALQFPGFPVGLFVPISGDGSCASRC